MNYNYILVFKFETGNKSSFVWLVYIMFFEIIIIYSFSICNRFIISFKNNIGCKVKKTITKYDICYMS